MRETELRIGNLLQDAVSKSVLVVSKLELGLITTIVVDRTKYPLENGWQTEPIPLTEEWLLRFGFEAYHSEFIIYNQETGFEMEASWSQRNVKTGERFGWRISGNEHVRHVHGLQNLYFALTGQELEIKP